MSRSRILCWILIALLSGASLAGVVDDAEEVLETVRGEEVVTVQVRGESVSKPQSWNSQGGTSAVPAQLPAQRTQSTQDKSAQHSRSGGSVRSPVPAGETQVKKAQLKKSKGLGKGQVLNFTALFLLIALVAAAVSFSNRSSEAP